MCRVAAAVIGIGIGVIVGSSAATGGAAAGLWAAVAGAAAVGGLTALLTAGAYRLCACYMSGKWS